VNYDEFVTLAASAECEAPCPTPDVLGYALAHPLLSRTGTWLEFGVGYGASLARIDEARGEAELWGFDSFRGLPEAWREDHPAGEFAQAQIPWPPDGVRLVVGRFEDTLPCFRPRSPVTLVHVDCDLYSAAKCALDAVKPHLAAGAIIVFDELLQYPGHEQHELRALYESGIAFEWLAVSGEKAAIRCAS